MSLSPGQILNNRYRIVKLLGKGGMGAVYKAWDLNMDRPRALKENLDTSAEAQRQFKREAQILGDLSHPSLPKVIDHFSLPGQGQYLVMDFVEGEDLDEMLRRLGGPLPVAQALDWIEQACAALEYLHTQNPPVIHRDVKPANIKITPQVGFTEGKAMLVDFGIAKVFDPNLSTTVGAKAVTPGYSPMEQYGSGQHTGPATDVYAVGATLYTLLSGQAPPAAPDRNLGASLASLSSLNPAITPGVEAAVMKAMAMQPQNRFRSATAFATALRSAPTLSPSPPLPAAIPMPQASGASYRSGPAAPAMQGVYVPAKSVWPTACGLAVGVAAVALGVIYMLIASDRRLWPFAGVIPIPAPTSEPVTWVRPSDGMVMISIPAGEFSMGSLESEPSASKRKDEKPQHKVYLNDYWIDQTEVTNAMFAQFVEQTGYQTMAEKKSWAQPVYNISTNDWEFTEGADWRHPGGPSSSLDGLEAHPVTLVSWGDATAYCAWAGGRLPSEAEWEKAASWDPRQQLKYKYPWGDRAPAGELLNFADINLNVNWADRSINDGYQLTAPVGSYPAGASPYGLLDMAGNVEEWVQDWYGDTYYASSPPSNPAGPSSGSARVLRGGDWETEAIAVRTTDRSGKYPDDLMGGHGFRCAR
jgi:formylglycine-generating enzyme required for sulfatase activity/tRNA A-37 threonylcarbamoyl transferase component Bud32